jgi:hypothetical protein
VLKSSASVLVCLVVTQATESQRIENQIGTGDWPRMNLPETLQISALQARLTKEGEHNDVVGLSGVELRAPIGRNL